MPDIIEKPTFKEKVKIMLGYCPANIDKTELIGSISEAQEKISWVLTGGEILQGFQKNGGSIEKLKELNTKLGEIKEKLDTVDDICKDIIALQKIHHAMADITHDDFRKDPIKAAKAFDEFFIGIGRICRLTPILKPYQQFFEGFNLFQPFAQLRLRKESEVYTDKIGGRNYAGQ